MVECYSTHVNQHVVLNGCFVGIASDERVIPSGGEGGLISVEATWISQAPSSEVVG